MLMVWLFILTNSLLIAGASKGARCFSAKEAEASAIIYALRRAEELGLFKIHVVPEERSAINGAEDWSIGSFMEDIEGLCKSFLACKFSFICRNLNKAAHRPAKFCFILLFFFLFLVRKFCFIQDVDFEWVGSFPPWPEGLDSLL